VIDDWSTYAVADFIPFTAEVYFRLIERIGERFWPLHLPAIALGGAIVWLGRTGRTGIACVLLAMVLAWVAVNFHIREYAELNWAGIWAGYAFLATAGLLVLFVLLPPARQWTASAGSIRPAIGLLLAAVGLFGYPLIAPLSGHGWMRAETFGIHADPTAVVALGCALILLRGLRLWLVAIVPLLWCMISALTLHTLEAAWAWVLVAAIALAGAGLIIGSLPRRHTAR